MPNIPEEDQTPTAKALLDLPEKYSARIKLLEGRVEQLKDEINVLKGQKKRSLSVQ